ncbi:MAG: hypothetical protein Q4D62_12960 [Planctomycetia bacterium]|nr:hypothetical protein [Planctomycetia bacterium]
MAVTSTTSNMLTLIQENGSDPTGEGGKIINGNFTLLDAMFEKYSTSWYAKNALNASYAEFACFAGTATSVGNSELANLALCAGFASPMNSYSYQSWPIAVWGNFGQGGIVSGSQPDTYSIPSGGTDPRYAGLPPLGPFFVKLLLCAYPMYEAQNAIFVECCVGGWNLSISFAKVLNAYTLNGETATVTPYTLGTYEDAPVYDGNCLYFKVYDNQLICVSTFRKQIVGKTHISAFSLYPSASDDGTCCNPCCS